MRPKHTGRSIGAMALCLASLLAACGGGEMSLTEYVESIDALQQRGIERYEALVMSPEGQVLLVGQGPHLGFDGQGAQLSDFTPHDLHVAMEKVADIQDEALEAAHAIEPPKQIADLHVLWFRELPIAELAARAGTAADWEELSATAEMAAYRTGLAADNEVCAEVQAKLDATTARGAFADTPWIPGELTEIVEYALGCDSLPANPEDAYRP